MNRAMEGMGGEIKRRYRVYERTLPGFLLPDIRRRAEAKLGRSLPPGWLAEYEHERAEA